MLIPQRKASTLERVPSQCWTCECSLVSKTSGSSIPTRVSYFSYLRGVLALFDHPSQYRVGPKSPFAAHPEARYLTLPCCFVESSRVNPQHYAKFSERQDLIVAWHKTPIALAMTES